MYCLGPNLEEQLSQHPDNVGFVGYGTQGPCCTELSTEVVQRSEKYMMVGFDEQIIFVGINPK
jgi:hypothetical protein